MEKEEIEKLRQEVEKLRSKNIELDNLVTFQRSHARRLELDNERLAGQIQAYKLSLERCIDVMTREMQK